MTYTANNRARYSARIRAYEQTPLWRTRAAQFIHTHGDHCDACGKHPPPGQPHTDVHHRDYTHVFTGRETDEELRGLCRTHHNQVHALHHRNPKRWTLTTATDHIINRTRRRRHRRTHITLLLTASIILLTITAAIITNHQPL